MVIKKDKKVKILEEIKFKIKKSESIIFAEYNEIKSDSLDILRKRSTYLQVEVFVIKNNLFKIAIKGTHFIGLSKKIKGQLIYAISKDQINVFKLFVNFFKENKKINKIKGGSIKERYINLNEIFFLSNLKNKKTLIIEFLNTINFHTKKIIFLLKINLIKLCFVLSSLKYKNIKNKKGLL